MINYDSKTWWEPIKHFNASYVIRKTARMCLKMGLFAAVIALMDYYYTNHPDLLPYDLHCHDHRAIYLFATGDIPEFADGISNQ